MADLSERGQMILVGGLAVAVSIVVLVVLLNSVIYTQNVATRSGQVDGGSALEYRNAIHDGTADLLDAENERNYTARGPLDANVTAGIETISSALRDQWQGSLAGASLDTYTLNNGTYVEQANASRDLTSASGGANWTAVNGADGIRSFVFTPRTAKSYVLPLGLGNDSARISVTGASGNSWELHVYNDSVDSTTYLAVQNGTQAGLTRQACGGLSGGDTVDLTAGTVAGSDCPALVFAEGTTAPWDVSVTYGNHTSGNYSFVANTTSWSGLNGPTSTDSPRWEPRIYDASLSVSYRSPELVYETRFLVAPGEDDE